MSVSRFAHDLCADNQVTVVEMQKEVGTSIYRTAKYKLLSLLQENGVEILTQHALAGVGEGTVALKQLPGGETVSVDADIVVMALGNRPDKAYEDKLAAAFDKVEAAGILPHEPGRDEVAQFIRDRLTRSA